MDLSPVYHAIIKKEFEKACSPYPLGGDWYQLVNLKSYLTAKEIIKIITESCKTLKSNCSPKEVDELFRELLRKGLLVKVGKTGGGEEAYRTLHFDIAVRAADIRTYYWGKIYVTGSWVLLDEIDYISDNDRKFHIYLAKDKSLGIPDYLNNDEEKFVKICFRDIKRFFEDSSEAFKHTINAFNTYFKESSRKVFGFDGYQLAAIRRILYYFKDKDVFIISAPTGAGKTEIFLFVAMAVALKSREYLEKEPLVIIIYPRKALEVDQAQRFIDILHNLNESLANDRKLILALDDGGVRELENELENKSEVFFRGLRCPIDGSRLKMRKDGKISCERNNHEFNWILSHHDLIKERASRINILITNPWTLEYRLKESISYGRRFPAKEFERTVMIIIDEAHEFRGLLGGAFKYDLRTLCWIARKNRPKIVLSSATIPYAEEFAKRLTGFDHIELIDYETLWKELYRDFKIRRSGKRLMIYQIISINPEVSYQTYIHELDILLNSIYYFRKKNPNNVFLPQAIVFIDNIKELRRTIKQYKEALSLGDPKDHLSRKLDPIHNTYAYHHLLGIYEEKFKEIAQDFQAEMSSLVDEVNSEVLEEKRSKIQHKLKEGEIATVYSTSSLELGVDYKNVSFIINAGVPSDTISLIQRVGRGGRSNDCLFVSHGIIVMKNDPLEVYNLIRILNFKKPSEKLVISDNNFAIIRRAIIHAFLSYLALTDQRTYVSKELIENLKEFKVLSGKILKLLENYQKGYDKKLTDFISFVFKDVQTILKDRIKEIFAILRITRDIKISEVRTYNLYIEEINRIKRDGILPLLHAIKFLERRFNKCYRRLDDGIRIKSEKLRDNVTKSLKDARTVLGEIQRRIDDVTRITVISNPHQKLRDFIREYEKKLRGIRKQLQNASDNLSDFVNTLEERGISAGCFSEVKEKFEHLIRTITEQIRRSSNIGVRK